MSVNLEHFVVLLVVSIVTIMLLHWIAARLGVEAETKRKFMHFAAGAIALTMPWLFDRPWPIYLLCLILLVSLSAVRWHPRLRRRFGEDLYAVGRKSIGELLIPVAIASLAWLAGNEKVLFVVPMLVVTTADGAAALAAKRYGLNAYQTISGKKTWEGTFVFFCVAFLVTIIPLLLLSNVGRGDLLVIGCLIGLIGCIIEATTWSGLDNFFIPLGTYFALKRFLKMSSEDLFLELTVVALVMILAIVWSRHTRLTAQANLSAVLVAFVLWSVGGIAWVTPAVAVFLLHPLLTQVPRQSSEGVDLRAILSVSSCSLVWMTLHRLGLLTLEPSLYAAAVGLVCHLCMISFVRRRDAVGAAIDWRSHLYWAAIGVAVIVGFSWVIVGSGGIALAVAAVLLAWLTNAWFASLPIQPNSGRRWVLQALLALLASYAGFLARQPLARLHVGKLTQVVEPIRSGDVQHEFLLPGMPVQRGWQMLDEFPGDNACLPFTRRVRHVATQIPWRVPV